jgi:hypothetical protein
MGGPCEIKISISPKNGKRSLIAFEKQRTKWPGDRARKINRRGQNYILAQIIIKEHQ